MIFYLLYFKNNMCNIPNLVQNSNEDMATRARTLRIECMSLLDLARAMDGEIRDMVRAGRQGDRQSFMSRIEDCGSRSFQRCSEFLLVMVHCGVSNSVLDLARRVFRTHWARIKKMERIVSNW